MSLEDEGEGVLNVWPSAGNPNPQDIGPGSDPYWIELQEEQKDVVYKTYRSANGISTPWDEGERNYAWSLYRSENG